MLLRALAVLKTRSSRPPDLAAASGYAEVRHLICPTILPTLFEVLSPSVRHWTPMLTSSIDSIERTHWLRVYLPARESFRIASLRDPTFRISRSGWKLIPFGHAKSASSRRGERRGPSGSPPFGTTERRRTRPD